MRKFTILTLGLCVALPAFAETGSAYAPWQLMPGPYTSSINDGRILAYPAGPDDAGFFGLVENSIMTMTADTGGFSRSTAAISHALLTASKANCVPSSNKCQPGDLDAMSCDPDPQCITDTIANQVPWGLGAVWENSNGGRGFTDSFCGGYPAGCATYPDPAGGTVTPGTIGVVLAGPPSAMDAAGKNFSPRDVASTGWPDVLRGLLPGLRGPDAVPDVCIAPPGLPDAEAHSCAPGLTFRTGQSALYMSPDAGRQWYPLSSSCGLPWGAGPDLVATDTGRPGHVVTWTQWNGSLDASGCFGVPSACSQRAIAWTGDVSMQAYASMLATKAGTPNGPAFVDTMGAAGPNNVLGWRYAALGHLALDAPGIAHGHHCDVAHAGIQQGCVADGQMCHAHRPTSGATNTPHDRFCADNTKSECSCRDDNGNGLIEANCSFPYLTSLTADPRGGQVYAPSNVGLLYSPDGGRKWRRHGHSAYMRWAADAQVNNVSNSAEPWPYDATPPVLDEATDPGVKILTMQGLPDVLPLSMLPNAGALDLNAQPELLEHLSRVSIVSTPCQSARTPFLDPLGFPRERVRVTATLSAIWKNPNPFSGQRLSGVFIAQGDSCTDAAAAQPLVFRDTANLMPDGADVVLAGDNWHWSPDSQPKSLDGQPVVKLPQNQVRGTADFACAMNYVAATLSPSDTRVLHAWGYGGGGDHRCLDQTGLWRSVDGGATWHLAAGANDPQMHGGFIYTARVVLSVSPTDAYHVMVTTTEEAAAVGGSNKQSMDFRATDRVVPLAYCKDLVCDWNRAQVNPCSGSVPPGVLTCQPDPATAVVKCAGLDNNTRRQCAVIPSWVQDFAPVPAQSVLQATVDCVACPAVQPNPALPAPACCLLERIFQDGIGDPKQDAIQEVSSAGGFVYTNAAKGNSGASIECFASVGDHWFVGADDNASVLKGKASALTGMSSEYVGSIFLGGGGMRKSETKPPSATLWEPDGTVAAIADESTDPTDALWRLTFDVVSSEYLRLSWFGGLKFVSNQTQAATSLRDVLPPLISNEAAGTMADGNLRIPARYYREAVDGEHLAELGYGHTRLRNGPKLAGGRRSLLASSPGMGVFIVLADKKMRDDFFGSGSPTGLSQQENSLNALGYAPLVPFPPRPDGSPSWPCVMDMVYDETGQRIFAVVARHATNIPVCEPTPGQPCNTPERQRCDDFGLDGPGLYAATLVDGAIAVTPGTSKLTLNPSVQFKKVTLTWPDGSAAPVLKNLITLADWPAGGGQHGLLLGNLPRTVAAGDTGLPGVWAALPVASGAGPGELSLRVARLADIGTVHDIVAAPDGKTAVAVALGESPLSWRDTSGSLYVGYRPISPEQVDNEFQRITRAGNQKHGIYQFSIPPLSQLAAMAPSLAGQGASCATLSQKPYLDPYAPDSAACQLIAGGTAGHATTGASNAGYRWYAVAREPHFGDLAAGTYFGEGAYVLHGPKGFDPTGFHGIIKGSFIPWSDGTRPTDLPAGTDGITWRAGYAAAYFRNTTMAPISTLAASLPTWLAPQLNLTQPGNLIQRVKLPAAVYRGGLEAMPTAPGELTLAFAADEPAEAIAFSGGLTGTFNIAEPMDDPRSAFALGRLRIALTGLRMPAGARLTLNGEPIGPDLSRLGTNAAFTALTGAVKVNSNTIGLTGC